MDSEDTGRKIQELQMLEQNIQNILLQKQAFQLELNETEHALDELKKSGDEVFKVIGQLMIKSEKGKMQAELEEREKTLGLRMQTLEKQEKNVSEQSSKLREEIMEEMQKKEASK